MSIRKKIHLKLLKGLIMQKGNINRIENSAKNFSCYKFFLALFLLLLALSVFSCFYALGSLPVSSWDEARHGVNAYEMMKTGNLIINTYNYTPDYWNLKPPMSFWSIILGFKLFGYGVIGLRFYSAFSMFLIIAICAIFIYKQCGRFACILTIGLLSTNQIFYVFHFARSGDADALFALFFTVSIISLYYLNKNIRFSYVNGLCFALAFLTKSWHALLIPVICILYIMISGEFKRVKAKNIIFYLLCSLMPVLVWAIIRYHYDGTTFFMHMVDQDLLARYSKVVERHKGGIFYYFYYFFISWVGVLFIAASIYFVFKAAAKKKIPTIFKNIRAHRSSMLFALWILVPLILYSIAKTKIEWYIFPALIPFIMLVSIMCSRIIKHEKSILIRYGFIALTIFVFAISCWGNIGQILTYKPDGIQNFIVNNVANSSSVKGSKAYMILNGGNWTQNNTFLSEAYADLKCKNGGLNSFLNSCHSVALDSLNDYNKNIEHFKGTKIISRDQTYVLILK